MIETVLIFLSIFCHFFFPIYTIFGCICVEVDQDEFKSVTLI